jgi:menaquinone-dependent protoporphyrinogen oxidase
MSQKILIAYATRYGSTREVAEKISDHIKLEGYCVELIPCKEVESLESYKFIIFGTPLYIGRMLKDAKSFLVKHQDELSKKPVAIFSLGPLRQVQHDLESTRSQLDQELKQFPWLKPVSIEMFGGKYDPKQLHFPDKFLTLLPASPLYKIPAIDNRNWKDIEKFINELQLF